MITIEVRNRYGVQMITRVPEVEDLLQEGTPLHFWIKAAVFAALKKTEGNRENAAKILQIGERTLYRYCKKFGFGVKEFKKKEGTGLLKPKPNNQQEVKTST